MFDYKKLFNSRELRLKILNSLRVIPDKPYIKCLYFIKNGKRLNLKYPKTLCEKMNWLKINNKKAEYTQLVDKIAVRKYVNNLIGEDICFPLLGFWEHYNDINFDLLPDQFVLKCNHDSGSVKVIKDKSKINHKELKEFFENRLKENPYTFGREYPYRDVKPMIFAEKYMVHDGEADINDYKFFCFNGKPEILFVATERSTDCKFDFYDMSFNHLDITNIHPQSGAIIKAPSQFEKMKELACKLSENMKFVRIDLYEIDDKVYFGEFTFFHASGFWPMEPEKWEYKLGDLIELDS